MKNLGLAILLLASITLTACGIGAKTAGQGNLRQGGNDIVETAHDAGQFTLLLAALQATDLTETLKGQGPFTVFAPTDEAFNALGPALGELINDPDTLRNILLYHVVSGRVDASQVIASKNLKTLAGPRFAISLSPSEVRLRDGSSTLANVIATDITASNGIIHVIDKVIVPPQSITAQVVANPALSQLRDAVVGLGLAEVLDQLGPVTVFAPTNQAFAAAGINVQTLLANDPNLLRNVILYHLVSGYLTSDLILNNTSVQALNGDTLNFSIVAGGIVVNSSNVTTPDILAQNGTIHVISGVLLP